MRMPWKNQDALGSRTEDDEPPSPSPSDIKEGLLRTGELENGAVADTVLPDDQVRGGEHLRAAEGAMTFRTFTDDDPGGDTSGWMAEELSSIAEETGSGQRKLNLPRRNRPPKR